MSDTNANGVVVLAFILAISVAACTRHASDATTADDYKLAQATDDRVAAQFKDCTFARIYIYNQTSSEGSWVYVGRCPNSTTNVQYKQGKSFARSIAVEGSHGIQSN